MVDVGVLLIYVVVYRNLGKVLYCVGGILM